MSQAFALIENLINKLESFVPSSSSSVTTTAATTTSSKKQQKMEKSSQSHSHSHEEDEKSSSAASSKDMIKSEFISETLANNQTAEITFREENIPGFGYWMHLKNIHYVGQSKYQDIKIIESYALGKSLVLDSKIQSSTVDEHLYHESLIHPSMILFDGTVKNVFIGGGGEYATAREILKYSNVEKVIMCDLDETVCNACKIHLKEMSKECYNDKRLTVIHGDARQYLLDTKEIFDVIIMDIADPIEAGPGIACYFKDFYLELCTKLSDNGIFVTQSGGSDYLLYEECFTVIHNTLKSSFKDCMGYSVHIPSFGSGWGFNIGFKNGAPNYAMDANKIDERICKIFNCKTVDDSPLRFYDGITHVRLFSLPKFIRQALAKETRVMSKDSKIFAH